MKKNKSETRYINVPMEFDVRLWATDCIREIDHYVKPYAGVNDIEVSVVMLNMHENTVALLRQIARGDATCQKKNTDCVSISRMLEISNALGLDPRRYFLLSE